MENKIQIISAKEFFNRCIDESRTDHIKLVIPKYQRPYKWSTKNVNDLLNDIEDANIAYEAQKDFRYRLGTIILHYDKDNNEYNIVDGQQRLITLSLIKKCVDPNFNIDKMIHTELKFNTDTKYNIQHNYLYAKKYINTKNLGSIVKKALDDFLEFVIITVDEPFEAFQLFDSQNSRGKALFPHDLLKAYHLREMADEPLVMKRVVSKWDNYEHEEIADLFSLFLYRSLIWSREENYKAFTSNDIDHYKGISEATGYTYAKRVDNAMPYFQITESFICGEDFFKMVEHYQNMKSDLEEYVTTKPEFGYIKATFENAKKSGIGFKYCQSLFLTALLFYYDKFKNLDELAVSNIFLWAFKLREKRKSLGQDSINLHALGRSNVFSENPAMFKLIEKARLHTEISSLTLTDKSGESIEKWSKSIYYSNSEVPKNE